MDKEQVGFGAENLNESNDFSPFNENVVERDYTRPNVQGVVDSTPIEEPIIIPPSFEDLNSSFQESFNEESANMESSDNTPLGGGSANEAMNDLDNKDKKKASQAMVEAVLDGYSQLCGFGNKLVQISPKKIDKLVSEGQINPNVQIPVQGGSIRVADYFVEYNKTIDGVLSVDDEFKDKVRPVMTRVFMKRDIGMTDEQLLAYYFGVDLIQKGATIYTLTSQNKQLINSIIELSQNMKGANQTYQSEPQRDYQEPDPTPEREFVEPNTREYSEPEEIKKDDGFEEFQVVEEKPKKQSPKMPDFGNKDILSEMENIAKQNAKSSSTSSTRGRKKKTI